MQSPSSDTVTPEEPPVPAETVRLPERGFTINRNKALIAAAVCWAGWAIMVYLVTHGKTGSFDEMGLLAYRTGDELGPRGSELLLESVRDLTSLGGVFLRNLIAIGAVAALLFLKLRREAVLFALTVVGGWIANTAVKSLIGRERPEIVPHLTHAGGESFPSGHSFSAAVVYIGMALAFAALSQRHSVRYTIIVAAMVLSAMVAWSRVMLGVHFPSDVTAGWLGGAGWAFLAAALLYKPAKAAADSPTAEKLDPATD
ncbi:phosphatase PAP2 family protein [Qipengyuania marisflavi]|uniref:Phosphatase PAP2 family protein n=1 Tax=Qipengyuania marisflavi TaxID=2486356 RepID=A0A5S3PBC0_9SPHN|nr:phosphatase PAP2 family protein [Qipengyuania marisflavi]TMM50055.1 phosphatase PAP2 family protein [Qipengyuania marisflavi]